MILCLLYFNRVVPCGCDVTCRAPPSLWENKDFYYYYYYYYYYIIIIIVVANCLLDVTTYNNNLQVRKLYR